MMKKYLLIFLVVVPLVSMGLWGAKMFYLVDIWSYQGPDMVFEVRPGETFSTINYRLAKKGLISSSKAFHRYAQFKGVMEKFRKGSFLIKNESNLKQVFKSLLYGTSIGKRIIFGQ